MHQIHGGCCVDSARVAHLRSRDVDVKKAVTDTVARWLQNPAVLRVATHPKVMELAMGAMSLRGQVASRFASASLAAARAMDLATRSEVVELRRTVRQLQDKISRMEAAQRKARGEPDDDEDEA